MNSTLRGARPWLLWSALAIPVGTLLHELTHYVAYQWSGVHEVVLHFNRVDGASPDHPAWALAAPALAGPLLTLLILGACGVVIWRRGPAPAFAAFGLVTPFRTFVPAAWLVIHALWGRANDANFDELNAMRALKWPRPPVMLLEIALTALGVAWVVRSIPREQRKLAILSSAIGGGLGIAAWWTLGPLVLP